MIDIKHVLGINERNIRYVYAYNPRPYYPLADDKVLTKKTLQQAGIPTPRLIAYYRFFYQLSSLEKDLKSCIDFVIKPARGMGGGGILLFDQYKEGQWMDSAGRIYKISHLYDHSLQILSGVYSIDNAVDTVMVEEKIRLDKFFQKITNQGIPDIRIIVFRHYPVMAMLRIPTRKSKGRANLHAGGIAVAIDLKSGVTNLPKHIHQKYGINPDTGEKMTGLKIPYWKHILDLAKTIQNYIPLGYLGIDFVIDRRYGPQVLELNVRPGLEIQNINGRGLKKNLEELGGEK